MASVRRVNEYRALVEDTDRGKPKYSDKKNCPSDTLYKCSVKTDVGSNTLIINLCTRCG